MPYGPPKKPKQNVKAIAEYREGRRGVGAAPYDHAEGSDDDVEGWDFTDPDEGSPWITPERTEALCAMVRKSVAIPVAAGALGLGDIWQTWMKTGREDKSRGKKPGFDVNESPYLYFLAELNKARCQAEATRTMAIHDAIEGDWKAADTLNTKIAPKRWHVAQKIAIEASMGGDEDVGKWSTAKLLQAAKGQLPDDSPKLALPENVVDGEIEGE